jgi:UDP-N-acetylmuramate dehydrogenase
MYENCTNYGKKNYTGLEFLCGIPGSLGGALAMNAGCYGGNIWENVTKVSLINKDGELIEKDKKDFKLVIEMLTLEK